MGEPGLAIPPGSDLGAREWRGIPTLAELLEDPELMMPPVAVVPRLAWAGRVTLLVGREKSGKSTLAAAAVSALTTGQRFLGEYAAHGVALCVNVEEHLGDFARKHASFNAEPDNIYVLSRVAAPIEDLERAIRETSPSLVVIDTLPTFVRALRPESGSAQDWGGIVSVIAEMARDHGPAVILLHHANKSDGEYRDSTAIGANVDMILTVREDQGDTSLRRVEPRGRFYLEPYAFHLQGDPMQGEPGCARILTSGEPATLEGQILAFIERHPGCSTSMIRDAVTGQGEKVVVMLGRLDGRAIEDRGTNNYHRWHLMPRERRENGPGPERNGEGTGPSQ